MKNIFSEEYGKLNLSTEEIYSLKIINFLNAIPKINIGDGLNIYFDDTISNISFTPIIPLNNIDLLFNLYNLNISKEDLLNKIIQIFNEEKSEKGKTYMQNGIKIQKQNNQIKIIDKLFIKDCNILSKQSSDGPYIIVDKIARSLFKDSISYKYLVNEKNNKKYIS